MADTPLQTRVDELDTSSLQQVVELYTDWLNKSHGNPPAPGSEWADKHKELKIAKELRDKLLEAAKLLLLKGSKGPEPLATRAFLWTLESKKQHYDSLTATAGAHQNRFPIANTYELGEALAVAEGTSTPQMPDDESGAQLHWKCSKIRAELRSELDDRCRQVLEKPKNGNAGDRSVLVVRQEFIALDLACCFEWRKNALEQYQRAFEDFRERLKLLLTAPPDVPDTGNFGKNPEDSRPISLKELGATPK